MDVPIVSAVGYSIKRKPSSFTHRHHTSPYPHHRAEELANLNLKATSEDQVTINILHLFSTLEFQTSCKHIRSLNEQQVEMEVELHETLLQIAPPQMTSVRCLTPVRQGQALS